MMTARDRGASSRSRHITAAMSFQRALSRVSNQCQTFTQPGVNHRKSNSTLKESGDYRKSNSALKASGDQPIIIAVRSRSNIGVSSVTVYTSNCITRVSFYRNSAWVHLETKQCDASSNMLFPMTSRILALWHSNPRLNTFRLDA